MEARLPPHVQLGEFGVDVGADVLRQQVPLIGARLPQCLHLDDQRGVRSTVNTERARDEVLLPAGHKEVYRRTVLSAEVTSLRSSIALRERWTGEALRSAAFGSGGAPQYRSALSRLVKHRRPLVPRALRNLLEERDNERLTENRTPRVTSESLDRNADT